MQTEPDNEPDNEPISEPIINPDDLRYALAPMDENVYPFSILGALLKQPGRILYELHGKQSGRIFAGLLMLALFSLALYGLVVGSLFGGAQYFLSAGKIVFGSLVAAAICLPSLYILQCLGGAEVSLRGVGGELLAHTALMGVLLVGFAPVAWIFSQSTDAVGLMAFLHLVFWTIALFFGLRLLGRSERSLTAGGKGQLRIWSVVYILVSLQMMTALRPIIGTSSEILPNEKKFFLGHALDVLNGK